MFVYSFHHFRWFDFFNIIFCKTILFILQIQVMKKLYYVFIALLISVLISCKNETKTIGTILLSILIQYLFSNVDFFSLPKGLQTTNKPIKKNFDIIYFPIDSIMTLLERKNLKELYSSRTQ